MALSLHRILVSILLACCIPVLAQDPWIVDPTFTPAFGQLEASPSGARTGDVEDFGFQSDGKIIVAGRFTLVEGRPVQNIARLNRDGSLDTNFLGGVNDRIHSMILDRRDRIVIDLGLTLGLSFTNHLSCLTRRIRPSFFEISAMATPPTTNPRDGSNSPD